MTKVAARKPTFETNLVDLVREAPAAGPAWVRKLRREALACFDGRRRSELSGEEA